MLRASCIAVLVLMLTCSDSADDCPCPAPFECVDGEEPLCQSAEDDVPSCRDTPANQHVPLFVNDLNIPIHWAVSGGCVSVTYSRDLASRAGDIAAAAASWTAPGCNELCLESPVQSDEPLVLDGSDRRIHLTVGTPTVFFPAETTSWHEPDTGRSYAAEIVIDTSEAETLATPALIRLFGFALGLSDAPPPLGDSERSVMEPYTETSDITSPTAADEEAICTLYGAMSYCGD